MRPMVLAVVIYLGLLQKPCFPHCGGGPKNPENSVNVVYGCFPGVCPCTSTTFSSAPTSTKVL